MIPLGHTKVYIISLAILETVAPGNDIVWSASAPLEWTDFEADPHPGLYQDALAVIRYDCKWNVKSLKKDMDLFFAISNIKLTTTMVRNRSWVRMRAADDALLAYVRGCFDLAEYMRPEMEEIFAVRFGQKTYLVQGSNEEQRMQYSKQESQVVLNTLDSIHKTLDLEIALYGKKTNYGRNAKVRATSDALFDDMKRSRLT